MQGDKFNILQLQWGTSTHTHTHTGYGVSKITFLWCMYTAWPPTAHWLYCDKYIVVEVLHHNHMVHVIHSPPVTTSIMTNLTTMSEEGLQCKCTRYHTITIRYDKHLLTKLQHPLILLSDYMYQAWDPPYVQLINNSPPWYNSIVYCCYRHREVNSHLRLDHSSVHHGNKVFKTIIYCKCSVTCWTQASGWRELLQAHQDTLASCPTFLRPTRLAHSTCTICSQTQLLNTSAERYWLCGWLCGWQPQ